MPLLEDSICCCLKSVLTVEHWRAEVLVFCVVSRDCGKQEPCWRVHHSSRTLNHPPPLPPLPVPSSGSQPLLPTSPHCMQYLDAGIVGAGTNNARLAGLLRGLGSYYYKEPTLLFLVRIAQGLVHMGKGLLTLNPYHTDNQLVSGLLHLCLFYSTFFTIIAMPEGWSNIRPYGYCAAFV